MQVTCSGHGNPGWEDAQAMIQCRHLLWGQGVDGGTLGVR